MINEIYLLKFSKRRSLLNHRHQNNFIHSSVAMSERIYWLNIDIENGGGPIVSCYTQNTSYLDAEGEFRILKFYNTPFILSTMDTKVLLC